MEATRNTPVTQAGVCYTSIIDIRPIHGLREWRYRITLATPDGERAVGQLGAADIVSYQAARKAIAKKYGAWLAISELECRPTARWSEMIADAMGAPITEAQR